MFFTPILNIIVIQSLIWVIRIIKNREKIKEEWNKLMKGRKLKMLMAILLIIAVAITYGLAGLIFWGIGSFIVWAFGIAFTFTFWHGLAIVIIINILTGIFGGKK